MHFELSPLIVWIALWIVDTFPEFQVNIFSNNRDITNVTVFCKSKKGHNSEKKKNHFDLSPLIVWISLWIVDT